VGELDGWISRLSLRITLGLLRTAICKQWRLPMRLRLGELSPTFSESVVWFKRGTFDGWIVKGERDRRKGIKRKEWEGRKGENSERGGCSLDLWVRRPCLCEYQVIQGQIEIGCKGTQLCLWFWPMSFVFLYAGSWRSHQGNRAMLSIGVCLEYTGWSKKRMPSFIFGITSVIQHRF